MEQIKNNKSWLWAIVPMLIIIYITLGVADIFPKCVESVNYCCGELMPDGGCIIDLKGDKDQSFGWDVFLNEKDKQEWIETHADCHMDFSNVTYSLFGYGHFMRYGCE